jgi:DnaK suppressor protein
VQHLTHDDIKQFDLRLRLGRQALLAAIRNRLHQGDGPGEMALANPYADVREQSEADLLADTDIGQLQLELADLQAIDEALARVSAGVYGICTGCGGCIALRRLRAQPAARMCLSCQESFEQQRQAPP